MHLNAFLVRGTPLIPLLDFALPRKRKEEHGNILENLSHKKERDYLKMKARTSKLTESEYVRQRLAEATPLQFPKYDWEEVAEEIREIGREINSLTALAYSVGYC